MEFIKKAFCSEDYGEKYVKSEEQSDSSILDKSKKIQKSNEKKSKVSKKVTQEKQDKTNQTGYMTFLAEEKKRILDSIKHQIAYLEGVEYSPDSETANEEIDEADWVEHLDRLGYQVFNEFLKTAIPLCRPHQDLSSKKLLYLRKKIKSWFDSEGIIETRGAAIVREDEVPEFIQALNEIIPSLQTRSFAKLRERILPVIEDIHKKSERTFCGNMFSKHYWSDFTNKYPEVKNLWKKLPRTRNAKENAETSSSTPSEKQEYEDNLKYESPDFLLENNVKVENLKAEETS